MTKKFALDPKDTLEWTSTVSNVLWSVGVLFAVSLSFIVSGAAVLVMMCLLRLVDLSA
jgi:hypothetical protein